MCVQFNKLLISNVWSFCPNLNFLAQFFTHVVFSFVLPIFFLLASLIYFFISSLKSLIIFTSRLLNYLSTKLTIPVFLDLVTKEFVSFGGFILPCFFVFPVFCMMVCVSAPVRSHSVLFGNVLSEQPTH